MLSTTKKIMTVIILSAALLGFRRFGSSGRAQPGDGPGCGRERQCESQQS